MKYEFNIENINPVYREYLENKNRYLMLYGGAGSGKSYFAAQKLIYRMVYEKNHKILLIRKVAKTIRHSQYSLLKSIIYEEGLEDLFKFKETDLSISTLENNNMIITAGVDDREKLKSISGISSIWIEEATEIQKKDFTQIDLRLRGQLENYKQIILSYNPIDANHWLNNSKFNDSAILKTTYKDNLKLDDGYIDVLENLKNEDEEYYGIYTLGNWGVLRNIIFKPFEKRQRYPSNYDEVIYGLDFGYNNPTALIKIGIKDNEFYVTEMLYEKKLTNLALINKMHSMDIKSTDCIYCDAAEPARIEEIKRGGYNSHPAQKNVNDGIDFMKSLKIYTKEENVNLNKELLSYVYQTGKDGEIFDEPVKFNDHAIDAMRYALYSHYKKRVYRSKVRIRFI